MSDQSPVPSRAAIAEELVQLMKNPRHWSELSLPHMRSLPSVHAAETGGAAESDVQVRHAVERAIEATRNGQNRKALRALINFVDPATTIKEGQEAAADALGIGLEAVRKGRDRALMEGLSDKLIELELAWCSKRIAELEDLERSDLMPMWYRFKEIETAVTIDEASKYESLERRLIVCRKITQPVVLLSTELPADDVAIEVLSGQDRGIYSHRFLGARPEDRAGGQTLLIFDLGLVPRVGGAETLEWRETARGYHPERPCVGINVAFVEALDKLTLRATVPTDQLHEPLLRQTEFVRGWLGGTDDRTVASEDLTPDETGTLKFEIHNVSGPFVFELFWQGGFERRF